MIQAIVYTSETGTTAQYAHMLAEPTGLPVYALKEASSALAANTEIAYLGWVMASGVKGFADAAKRYRVRMVCAVGMAATGTQTDEVRKASAIPADTALFTLQGGFYLEKLRGMYRLMMRLMRKALIKQLSEKPNRTPADEDMIALLEHGGNRVSEANLAQPLAWLAAQKG